MKKSYTLIAFLFFVFSFSAEAQVPAIQWQKCLGGTEWDQPSSIKQTSDGGYIIAGNSSSLDGDVSGNHGGASDYWIVKLNSTGTIQWQKCFGGSDDDVANSIEQTSDGGYIIAGYSNSLDGDVSGNQGNNDYWIVKLDPLGNITWQNSFGGSLGDMAYDIHQTNDGGYIVAGSTSSFDGDVSGRHGVGSSGWQYDYWVVKLNSTGIIQWQKCLGGSDNDYTYSIKQTNDGGYIVAGGSDSNDGDVSGNHGSGDCWIVKLNNIGVIQWQICMGGSSGDRSESIEQTVDGGYIFTGFTQSNDGDVTGHHSNIDYWVVKLDGRGSIQWQKTLGGSLMDYARSIAQTTDSGYIVAGHSDSFDGDVAGSHGSGDYWIVKLNSIGDFQWRKCLGGTGRDWPYSIKETSDGGYIIAGLSGSNDDDVSGNHGYNNDYWIVKLEPDILNVADLFVKDQSGDLGLEPNTSTLPMWQSEDIWLRQSQDPTHAFAHITQNANYYGSIHTNYVYIKLHNRGGVASTGTEQLMLYWAKASSGLSWTSPWIGGTYFDPPSNTMLMGSPIGTVTLPVVSAGDSTIAEFAWNLPNPNLYSGSFQGDASHFCLLARVVTSTGMKFPETADLYANVQNNNNIAWKNISVYDFAPGPQVPAYATIANLTNLPMNVKVKFSAADADGSPVLLNKGILRLTMNGELKDIILKNKIIGEGFKHEGNGVFTLSKEGGYLNSILLKPNDFGTINMEYVPNNADEKLTGYTITVTQIENTGGKERIIGGQTAVFGKVKGFGTSYEKNKGGFGKWWHWLLILLIVFFILWLLLRRKK
ncbi:MAG: hypothetical protein ABIN97_13415 [Ginsengibacter sp.]